LARLGSVGLHREILSLFAALDFYRRDLHAQETREGLLQVTQRYVAGLNLFEATGIYLVNATDHGFDLAASWPGGDTGRLDRQVKALIRAGRFARALRQASPVFFQSTGQEAEDRGLLHSLAVPGQVLGVFCGLLRLDLEPTREIAFSLLSMLLGAGADALVALDKTAQLKGQIKTLSGLMPICAWCKKVRDDRGYWEQIEAFLQHHSGASVSHGICPECHAKFMAGLPQA
jgi:hypothetical protein